MRLLLSPVVLVWACFLPFFLAGCGENPESTIKTGWWPHENQVVRYRVWFNEVATSTSDPDSPDEGMYDYIVSVSKEGADRVRISVRCEKMVIDGQVISGWEAGRTVVCRARICSRTGRIDVSRLSHLAVKMLLVLFAPDLEFDADERPVTRRYVPPLTGVKNQDMPVRYGLESQSGDEKVLSIRFEGKGSFGIEADDQKGQGTFIVEGQSLFDSRLNGYVSGHARVITTSKVTSKRDTGHTVETSKNQTWHWELLTRISHQKTGVAQGADPAKR